MKFQILQKIGDSIKSTKVIIKFHMKSVTRAELSQPATEDTNKQEQWQQSFQGQIQMSENCPSWIIPSVNNFTTSVSFMAMPSQKSPRSNPFSGTRAELADDGFDSV